LLGVLTSGALRLIEVAYCEQFAHNTLHAFGALILGADFFCGASHIHATLRRQFKEKAYCTHLQAAFSTLITEMQDRGQLAEKLAVLLTDLHEKIAHYESQARENGLPLYEPPQDKSGGA
jgi:hypothetical protein